MFGDPQGIELVADEVVDQPAAHAHEVVVLVGVAANPADLNCGFCGQGTCEALQKINGICSFNAVDLGIATSSAGSCPGSVPSPAARWLTRPTVHGRSTPG